MEFKEDEVIEDLQTYNDQETEIIEDINESDDIISKDSLQVTKECIYQCTSCNINFTNIKDHIERYHLNNPVKDEDDEEIILEELGENDDNEINLALVGKNEAGKYACSECNKSFKVYHRFVTHLKSHHSLMVEDYRSLEQGTSKDEDNEQYEKLQNSEGTIYRCKNCNTDFDSRKKLLLHKIIHKNVENLEKNQKIQPVKRPIGNINCKQCNKSFLNKLEFDLHVQAHDENKALRGENSQAKESVTSEKGGHPCGYCGKQFKRPHEKVKHERIHSGVKPYSCDICGKQFRVSYCLSLHKRNVHSDDRPYICTFPGCNKKFKAQSVYNHHINTHSDERKFQCPFCPKTFKTSVQLAGHKNTHTKPFSCKICKRPFSSLYAVKNHMQTHNNQDSNLKLSCKICGAQYARTFALKDHVRTAHPENHCEIEEYIIETEMDMTNDQDSELYSVLLTSENTSDI